MDAFSPEMINVYRTEMQREADHYHLVKIARANRVSWLRRITHGVQHWFAVQQAQRRQTRQAEAWETAERIAASNPHLTASNC